MSIEFKIKSSFLQREDIQEQFPDLLTMVNSYLPKKKTAKRSRKIPLKTASQK